MKKKLAEISNLVKLSGEHPVKHIGDAGNSKDDQGRDFIPVLRSAEKHDHEHGNQDQPHHGQGIRDVPYVCKEFTQTVFQRVSASFR